MKICLVAIAAALLTACSTPHRARHRSPKSDPETVMVIYHVRAGAEAEFQEVLERAWRIYRARHLVQARPHSVIRKIEDGNKTRFVEVFTWVSHSAPEHAPDVVRAIWAREQSLCERRNGHGSIEGGELKSGK